jgi:hypothetical protein
MYITEIILEKNLYYIFRDYIARKLTGQLPPPEGGGLLVIARATVD